LTAIKQFGSVLPNEPALCARRARATTAGCASSIGCSSTIDGDSICARAKGRTLELAIGTGLNPPYFPMEVDLVGIDLSAEMLAIAGRRARQLGVHVDLKVDDAQALDLPDSSFDTVGHALLSTVPDPPRASAEAWRVLKRGGQLLLLRSRPKFDERRARAAAGA
jgi:ubiquinone/menaquinone biosynthesis C-methylase UbiE